MDRRDVVYNILNSLNKVGLIEDQVILPVLLNINRALITWAFYKGKPNSFTILDLTKIAENNRTLKELVLTFYDLWRQEVFNIPLSLTQLIEKWRIELTR